MDTSRLPRSCQALRAHHSITLKDARTMGVAFGERRLEAAHVPPEAFATSTHHSMRGWAFDIHTRKPSREPFPAVFQSTLGPALQCWVDEDSRSKSNAFSTMRHAKAGGLLIYDATRERPTWLLSIFGRITSIELQTCRNRRLPGIARMATNISP